MCVINGRKCVAKVLRVLKTNRKNASGTQSTQINKLKASNEIACKDTEVAN